jgi:hypothetical protein
MKASFDGSRIRLAECFNRLCKTDLSDEQYLEMENLRYCIVGLLCMYDDRDSTCLIDSVRLEELQHKKINKEKKC